MSSRFCWCHWLRLSPCVWLLLLGLAAGPSFAQDSAERGSEPRWWKGNLHTHSFWSDGDDFPEMIIDWYKQGGYHFLALSDHNVLQQGVRWIKVGTNTVRIAAVEKYLERFGTDWVERRRVEGEEEVRLKPFSEYRSLFEEAGRFLLIPSEEITDKYQSLPVHLNATNLRDYIPPQGGNSVREVMQNNVDAVLVQRRTTGQLMLPHLNHPNFHWGVTAEDLAWVRGEQFFEVYNGHPEVNDPGDERHASTERMWDIALCLRLTGPDPEPLFAVAVDDSHHYHKFAANKSNPGRGWIMARSRYLTPESMIRALEAGDFYASSGVVLREVTRSPAELLVEVKVEEGVTYRTQFVGTRRGANLRSEPVLDADGQPLPVTRRYGEEVGELLKEVEGPHATYRLNGNELYVRARVLSSKLKDNGPRTNDLEMAWTQPVIAR